MPHPLPEDIGGVTGLRWFLVAVPDDPAFTRAAMDVYTDLGNYWKWGLEGPVPGESDAAAQLWAAAVDETLEALEMGFPETLLGYIDEVEALLLALQGSQSISVDCCGNLAPVDETASSDIVEGVGDPPVDWGDEPVADWDDWHELVCGAAHAYVDLLVSMAAQLDALLTVGAIGIGIVAGILGLLAGAGILLAISYGAAAGVVAALADAVGSAVFSDAEGEIEAARDDIVCGVFDGDLAAQVEAAVSATAWTLFFQFIDYESARNVMLEGDHGAETLEVNRRTDCNCEGPVLATTCIGTSLGNDQYQSVSEAGCHRVVLWFPESVTLTGSFVSGQFSGCGGVNTWRTQLAAPECVPQPGEWNYDSNTAPTGVTCNTLVVISGLQFTIEVTW